MSSDEEIIRRALIDKEVFALIIERYEAKLLRYLERLGVGLREDREDILQNAFVKAYKNLNNFDLTLTFSSWMYRIAHNETMSFFRAKRARPQVILGEEGGILVTELKDDDADASLAAEARISREELTKAFRKLPQAYQDVLTLRFFEDCSYAEMSDILEMPVGTISTLLHRAKRALRAALPTTFSP